MAILRTEDVLRRPLITEKNTMLMEQGKYSFEVAPTANKVQIRQAVEQLFNVTVIAVNTLKVKPKGRSRAVRRGRGRIEGHSPAWKKAVVTLGPDQSIDIFEQV